MKYYVVDKIGLENQEEFQQWAFGCYPCDLLSMEELKERWNDRHSATPVQGDKSVNYNLDMMIEAWNERAQ